MPFTKKAKKIRKKFKDQYGDKGEQIYYATANKQGRKPESFEKESLITKENIVIENGNDIMIIPVGAHIIENVNSIYKYLVSLSSLNESTDVNLDKIKSYIEKISKIDFKHGKEVNNLHGGLGDNININDAINKFGLDQLSKGVKIELEHTNNILLALEIAIDHLAEDKLYYDKLELMEKGALDDFIH